MSEEKTAVRPDATVTLREITKETLRDILRLKVTEGQDNFVAPNAISISEAYFEPKAWFRGIYANETAVGFAMLFVDEEEPVYYLWRYMIAAPIKKWGLGRKRCSCSSTTSKPTLTPQSSSYPTCLTPKGRVIFMPSLVLSKQAKLKTAKTRWC